MKKARKHKSIPIWSLPYVQLIIVVSLSLFFNLYRIGERMMFIGDFGRDYLAAREMVLIGVIPLLGITSSVVWLHQGPLSIYFIGIAFLLGHFHPVAPAILYGVIGAFSTGMVYLIGRTFFNTRVGLLAGIFYATSPLIVVNARMPYHTTSIPFFSCVFFLLLYKVLQGRKILLPPTLFFLGILLQLELSNAVVLFLLGLLWFIYKPRFEKKLWGYSVGAFLLGILPFIIYDLSHRFIQTGGLLLWIVNRTRLFFGLTIRNESTTAHLPGALQTITQQIGMVLFPLSGVIIISILCGIIYLLWQRRLLFFPPSKDTGLILITLWVLIPLIGYSIHAAPGTAYFPLLFPAIALLVGYTFSGFSKRFFLAIILFLFVTTVNGYTIIKEEYFLTTMDANRTIPFGNYSIGSTWTVQDTVAKFLVSDAGHKPLFLKGGGSFGQFASNIDNYRYLVIWRGGDMQQSAKLIYTIYPSGSIISAHEKNVYNDANVIVTKQEK